MDKTTSAAGVFQPKEQRQRYNEEVYQTLALVNCASDFEIACRIRAYVFAMEKSGSVCMGVLGSSKSESVRSYNRKRGQFGAWHTDMLPPYNICNRSPHIAYPSPSQHSRTPPSHECPYSRYSGSACTGAAYFRCYTSFPHLQMWKMPPCLTADKVDFEKKRNLCRFLFRSQAPQASVTRSLYSKHTQAFSVCAHWIVFSPHFDHFASFSIKYQIKVAISFHSVYTTHRYTSIKKDCFYANKSNGRGGLRPAAPALCAAILKGGVSIYEKTITSPDTGSSNGVISISVCTGK